jgi:hypothetical protein
MNNDMFSTSALAITMPILAVATYAAALNMDGIAAFLGDTRHLVTKAPMTGVSWAWIPGAVQAAALALRGRHKRPQKQFAAPHLEAVHVQVQVDVESCSEHEPSC